ncbi:SixA phosphatase family protein [Ensifer oleiphilus]
MARDHSTQTYRLMLLRHAKSAWPEGVADHDRPLGERGRNAAPLVGAYMERKGLIPGLAIVSTARRARETWTLVKGILPPPIPARETRDIYEVAAPGILATIRAVDPAIRNLLVVGHNPGMEDLAHQLAGSGKQEALARMQQKFPTAALAVFEFDGSGWEDLAPDGCRLIDFVTPRQLA